MKIRDEDKYTIYKCDNCDKEVKLLKQNYKKKKKYGKYSSDNKDLCSSCSGTLAKKEWFNHLNEQEKEAWKKSISKGSKNRKIKKVECEKCGRVISSNQYNNHLKFCDGNPVPKKERGEKLNGKSSWNKGLTKETDERVNKYSKKLSKILKEKYEKGDWIPFGNDRTRENTGWSWGKGGYHTSWNNKKFYYRSGYELHYMNILDEKKINYEIESLRIKYFNSFFNEYKFAKPDIYIPDENLIIEIKATNTLNEQEMLDKKKAYLENGYSFKLILDKKEINF